jgi:ribose 5-phosphate isomerase B
MCLFFGKVGVHMKVIVGSAVKGYDLKMAIVKHLQTQGHEVIDVGCYNKDTFIKYTSVGERVAKAIQEGVAPLAISCCGSGTGASLSAGKFAGVCAVSCESVKTARLARVVNDANVLCLGEDIVSPELGCAMADAFINAKFQDAPGTAPAVLAFWQEAKDEMRARGEVAKERALETVKV